LAQEPNSVVSQITLRSPKEEFVGRFGGSLAGVPDTDNDGVADVIVGAPWESVSAEFPETGRVHVFSGATGAHLLTLISPITDIQGRFGAAVAGIGDVNGNGSGEIIVGAYEEEPQAAPFNYGRAYLFDGASGTLIHTLSSPNQQNNGYFGMSVAGVSDLSGDGLDDIVIAAQFEDLSEVATADVDAGRVYVFNGATGALLHMLASPNSENTGWFGNSIAGIGDLTNDGRGEVLVGALNEDPGASPDNAGRVYLFDGLSGGLIRTFTSPDESMNGNFGQSVASLPDVNLDSKDEIIIGAHREDPAGSPENSGQAHIFDGATGNLIRNILSPHAEADGAFGVSVAGVADVNADGSGEILVGATHQGPGASPIGAGRAYLFNGSTGELLHEFVSPNEDEEGYFGRPVAAISDLNNDGRGDAIIGAFRELSGADPEHAGRAYIFVSPFSNDALVMSQTIPPQMAAGKNWSITIEMQNRGDLAWSTAGGYALGIYSDECNLLSGLTRVAIAPGESVPPGESREFELLLSAPPSPDTQCHLELKMVQEFVEWFGDPLSVAIDIVPAVNDAEHQSTVMPATLAPSQSLWISIVMKNTGTTAWFDGSNHKLSVTSDPDGFMGAVQELSILPKVVVTPGKSVIFMSYVTAPATPGSYNLQMQMIEQPSELFGEVVSLTLTVQTPANGARRWSVYE